VYIAAMTKQLTTKEAAEILGVSHDTITRWVKIGKMKGTRKGPFIGRTSPILIPLAEVERVKKLQNDQAKR
jgi:excisionase family DNA binding protein